MINALIFGAGGFLGRNLILRCLAEKNVTLTLADIATSALENEFIPRLEPSEIARIRAVEGDIRDEDFLADVIRGQDVIFNCAAQASHTLSMRNPVSDAEINCLGHLKVLESVACLNERAVLVYPSSTTVIGKVMDAIADETHPENPLEIYSANKGIAEKYYRIYFRRHGIGSVILRFSNLYGPFGKPSPEFGFINYFIHLAAENDVIRIFGSGRQIRNVLFVEDAADLMWRAWQCPDLYGDVFLATSPYHLSVKEIAETIVSVWGTGRIEHMKWPPGRKQIEVGDARFSARKLKARIAWDPQNDLAAGLQKTKFLNQRFPASPYGSYANRSS